MPEFNTKENYLKLSDICSKIQQSITAGFGNNKFWIQAEVSSLRQSKGHCYINLIEKETNSTSPKANIRGMIWDSDYSIINNKFKNATGFDLKDNIKILFLAVVNYHISHGLNLTIQDIEPGYTLGTMLLEREAIVKRLKDEGHYFLNKQRVFPIVPQRIALISAKDAEGYKDFINKIEKNIYHYKFSITLFSSLLQGDKAAVDIKNRLIEIYRIIEQFDLVVIARGGGGSVNLNCFNDYNLSKAVARFPIPVITGIGHTSNISIVDEVAYLDKITPTDVGDFLIDQTLKYEDGMKNKFQTLISRYNEIKNVETNNLKFKIQNLFHSLDTVKREQLNFISAAYLKLVNYSKNQIKESEKKRNIYIQTFDKSTRIAIRNCLITIINQADKIKSISKFSFSAKKGNLRMILRDIRSKYINCIRTESILNKGRSDKIGYLDPKNILRKGYSITLKNGKAITNSEELKVNDLITTLFFEGEIESSINKKNK